MSRTDSPERIREAFLKMIEERPFSDITMKGVADELGMTRQNIYRYYSSKEQIFADIVEERLDSVFELVEQMAPDFSEASWPNLVDLATQLLYSNKQALCAVMQCGQDETMYKLTKAFLKRCLGHMARVQGITIRDQAYFEVVTSQLAGGGYYMVKAWTENDMEIPPDKISKIHQSHSGKLLMELVKACE